MELDLLINNLIEFKTDFTQTEYILGPFSNADRKLIHTLCEILNLIAKSEESNEENKMMYVIREERKENFTKDEIIIRLITLIRSPEQNLMIGPYPYSEPNLALRLSCVFTELVFINKNNSKNETRIIAYKKTVDDNLVECNETEKLLGQHMTISFLSVKLMSDNAIEKLLCYNYKKNFPLQRYTLEHLLYYIQGHPDKENEKILRNFANVLIKYGHYKNYEREEQKIHKIIIGNLKKNKEYLKDITEKYKDRNMPNKNNNQYKNIGENGVWRISCDIKKANFTGFHYHNKNLTNNCDTYEEMIAQFTNDEFFIMSKQRRQVILQEAYDNSSVQIQEYIMSVLFTKLCEVLDKSKMQRLGSDELIVNTSLDSIKNDVIIVKNCINSLPENMRNLWKCIPLYLRKIGNSELIEERTITDLDIELSNQNIKLFPLKIKNGNRHYNLQAEKFVLGEPLTEIDMQTEKDSYPVTFIEPFFGENIVDDRQLLNKELSEYFNIPENISKLITSDIISLWVKDFNLTLIPNPYKLIYFSELYLIKDKLKSLINILSNLKTKDIWTNAANKLRDKMCEKLKLIVEGFKKNQDIKIYKNTFLEQNIFSKNTKNEYKFFTSLNLDLFQCCKTYYPELVNNCDTWKEFILGFDNGNYFVDSEQFKKSVFGKLFGGNGLVKEALITTIYEEFKNNNPNIVSRLFLFDKDKICYETEIGTIKDNMEKINNSSKFKVSHFCLKSIGSTQMFEKRIITNIDNLDINAYPVEITGKEVPIDFHSQAYKHVLGLRVSSEDLESTFEKKKIRYDNYFDFD